MKIPHELFNKSYVTGKYNCANFVTEAWFVLTGRELDVQMQDVFNKTISRKTARNFVKIEKPDSLCLVLVRDVKENHVGIVINNKVLHLKTSGVEYVPLHFITSLYKSVRYYKPCLN